MTLPKPWPHQQRALDFVRKRRGAMLAMEMGTAKTRVVIMRIEDLVQSKANLGERRVLIFCPKAVIDTWTGQLDEWMTPDVRGHLVVSAPKQAATSRRLAEIEKDAEKARQSRRVHVVVTNYEATRSEALRKWLKSRQWSIICCDESQAIKSHDSKQSKFIATLDAIQRVCLSGTPTPHSPLDWFGQMRFLSGACTQDRGAFDVDASRWRRFVPFRSRYAVEVPLGRTGAKKITGYQRLDELENLLAPWVFQVKARDVLTLPGVQHVRRAVDLSARERKAYQGVLEELIAVLDDGEAIVANNVLDRLLKCQQITGGSCKVTDEISGERRLRLGTTKRDTLAQLLTEIPEAEPMAVFARFRSDLDAIGHAAEDAGRTALELSGRRNELAEWKSSSGGEVLAVQIQSGGAGIDLTRARFVAYWSVGFSLGDFQQSLARAHRPGQKREVQYVHLVARDTIDEVVYRALAKRRDLIEESLAHVRAKSESLVR